jgi:aminoglycoside phosphotransferase family enzyme/predicted kinase
LDNRSDTTKDADQTAVFAFLSDPGSYAGADSVERVETHGNIVFLAGSDAWKIKRAIRFSYMDFSTLEKRRVACEREVAINRQFSSDLYLGCVPITRSPEGVLSFGGTGEVVEWAVHMRRFEQSSLLSHLAERGQISDQIAKDLADTIYASHVASACNPRPTGRGAILDLVNSVCDTLAMSDKLDRADVSRLAQGLTDAAAKVGDLLDARARSGFVRRCHGDLHLANIVMWQGRPALYDAIEFDEALATIDTLYDLAFLLMDLERYGQRRAANIALNRYLWRSQQALDIDGLAALPLFMALRAAIRGMITLDRAVQEDAAARQRDVDRAQVYIDSAFRHIEPSAPRLIAIGGLSGTGKTTLAAALAPFVGGAPGATHFRSDLERKALAGVGELDRLPESAYTQASSAHVYGALAEKARAALAAGRPVVVDAVYAREHERRDIEKIANGLDVPFSGIWLTADRETLVNRVARRHHDASDATENTVAIQANYDVGTMSPAWVSINAGGTAEATLQLARTTLDLKD